MWRIRSEGKNRQGWEVDRKGSGSIASFGEKNEGVCLHKSVCVCLPNCAQKVRGEVQAHSTQTQKIEMDSRRHRSTVCVCMCVHACTRLQACVLIATVREPLSDGQLIGHLTSTEEAARKLAKRATGFNLIPNSFLSRCCPLNNSLSQGNGRKIKKNRTQNRGGMVR